VPAVAAASQAAATALDRVGLGEAADRPLATLSKGMRQRAKLAGAIAHEPDLLVLDEPFIGLDPVARHDLVGLVRGWSTSGSLLVASHLLHEIEALDAGLAVILGGRLVASGDVEEIHALVDSLPAEVRLEADRPRRLAEIACGSDLVDSLRFEGPRRLAIGTHDPRELVARLAEAAAARPAPSRDRDGQGRAAAGPGWIGRRGGTMTGMTGVTGMTGTTGMPAAPITAAWRGILAVTGFQLRRLLAPQRVLLAAVGAAFPAAVMLAVRKVAGELDRDFAVILLYALVPEAVCMLGLLVTMCPVVADELERGTWQHVVVRPGGRRSLLVGTFLAAVIWTATVALVSLGLSLVAADLPESGRLGAIFAALVVLSCIGRAALFSLPAVIVPKRALVASVAAAIVVEYLAGFLPAVVNQLTVSLRLRSLLVEWMGWGRALPAELQLLVDTQPAAIQIAAVLALAAVLLAVASGILARRQFPPAEESS